MKLLKTLSKFNEDKSYKYFPGVSIVKNFSNQTLIDLIKEIKCKMESSGLFEKFVFLPEDSYHMTVSDLVTLEYLKKDESFKDFKLRNEKNMDVIDQYILKELNQELFSLNVEMKTVRFTTKKILLEPATKHDKEKLDWFRKYVYQKLNIKMDNDYHFHISLAYQLETLTDEESDILKKYLDDLYDQYHRSFHYISIDDALLVAFNDMSQFERLSKGRSKLGFYNEKGKKIKQEAVIF